MLVLIEDVLFYTESIGLYHQESVSASLFFVSERGGKRRGKVAQV